MEQSIDRRKSERRSGNRVVLYAADRRKKDRRA